MSVRLPTGCVAAGESGEAVKLVQDAFMNRNFRVYTSPDIVGVELGGALKNVVALSCGICDGMNAGAYGGEMGQVVQTVALLDVASGVKTLSKEEMEFGYRRSILTDHPDRVVLSAVFRLTPGDPAEIRANMEALMAKRKASQPLEWPSAGSTFKRPAGHFAGTLIDQCGLKGLTVGGAQVSEKHAGFIINRGGATFADVVGLIAQVQERVLAATGVRLEPEVKIVR